MFKDQHWKISVRGVILVMVPLCFSWMLLGALFVLLSQTEGVAAREAHARDVSVSADTCQSLMLNALRCLTAYAITSQPEFIDSYDRTVAREGTEEEHLCRLVGGHPRLVQSLAMSRTLSSKLFKIGSLVKEDLASRDGPAGIIHVNEIRVEARDLLKEYLISMGKFLEAEREQEQDAPLFSLDWRNHVKQVLAFGVVGNALIGCGLAFFFSRGITTRLAVLVENAQRLSQRRQLLPALSGSDEIASLDRAFRDMADRLDELARKERAIVENAADVICSLSAELEFLAVNPACQRVWRYRSEELIGKSLLHFTAVDSRSCTADAFRSLVASQTSGSFESSFVTSDGIVVEMLWSGHWSEAEKALFAVAHDITERNVAERLLKESKELVSLIVESLPVGLVVLDERGRIERTNRPLQQMVRYSREDLRDRHIQALFADRSTSAEQFSERLVRNFSERTGEMTAVRQDGTELPVEVTVNKFSWRSSKKHLVNLLDVSQRHEIEQLKREFVAMVSHDLRAPLSSMLAALTLAVSGAFGHLNEAGEKAMKVAERETERLISLINQLLDLEKIESGRLQLNKEIFQMAQIVDDAVNAVRYSADKVDVALEVRSAPLEGYVDGQRLVQVIVNLLSNAIKFSPAGSTVTVTLEEVPHAIEVKVIDRGKGIPPAFHKTIFDRFRQVEAADGMKLGGIGLGLAICKTIVESHEGEIGVDSSVGQGSTFWFRIPLPNEEP